MSPPGFRLFSPPFRGAFQLSLTVLVRYRSRDVFSLGSWCLPTSHGKTKPWYSGTPALPLPGYAYGAVTLYGGVFQPTSASPARERPGPYNTTSPSSYPRGIWFGLSPFRSPLLRGSLLVSSPPPTKMFPFGGFPFGGRSPTPRTPRAINPWQEVPFGDPRINGRLRLPGAYRRLPRPSSAPEPSHPPGGLSALNYQVPVR